MPLTNSGKVTLAARVLGKSSTPFDETHAMIGVGNSNTSFIAEQNDLVGSSKIRVPMDSGFPKIDTEDPSIMIFRSTFNEVTANFEWNEWAIFNSGNSQSGGVMLVRSVDNIGIKELGSVWVFTAYVKFTS